MNDERWIDLETRLSHVDETVQVLNEVVTAQSRRIEQLEALCRSLAERLRQAELGDSRGPLDERPPHY